MESKARLYVLAALFALAGVLSWQEKAQASLISWWRAEGNALDSTDSNNGTIVGNVSFVPGAVGQAFNFDGTDYIHIQNNLNLQPAQITISGLIKPVFSGRPFQFADADTIFEDVNSNLTGYGLFVAMDPTFPFLQAPPGGVPLGTPTFFLNVGGAQNQIFGSSPIPNDGNFHLVEASYDGATMRLFLDGVEGANRSISGSILYTAGTDAFIGRENAFPRHSEAAIDEVKVFDNAITAAPEPSTFLLLATGCVGLLGYGWRHRQRTA